MPIHSAQNERKCRLAIVGRWGRRNLPPAPAKASHVHLNFVVCCSVVCCPVPGRQYKANVQSLSMSTRCQCVGVRQPIYCNYNHTSPAPPIVTNATPGVDRSDFQSEGISRVPSADTCSIQIVDHNQHRINTRFRRGTAGRFDTCVVPAATEIMFSTTE
jgi:hypothetical protein